MKVGNKSTDSTKASQRVPRVTWALSSGYHEVVVKTKNRFYDMRGTLDHLRFEVVKYERHPADNAESKVYLSKKIVPELLRRHRSSRTVVQATL